LKAINVWRQQTRRVKTETYTLYLAYKDSRTPWYARLFAALVVGYAFSPIDLIPDFVPVLGYLDDLILVPLGAALALKMIPPDVLTENRDKASELMSEGRPTNWAAAVVVVVLWLLLVVVAVVFIARLFQS
jgi:uncharacterized membrane protein YkvA (DUF1232 family)